MQCRRNQLLAGAALSVDQDGGLHIGQRLDQGIHPLHSLIAADDTGVAAFPMHLFFQEDQLGLVTHDRHGPVTGTISGFHRRDAKADDACDSIHPFAFDSADRAPATVMEHFGERLPAAALATGFDRLNRQVEMVLSEAAETTGSVIEFHQTIVAIHQDDAVGDAAKNGVEMGLLAPIFLGKALTEHGTLGYADDLVVQNRLDQVVEGPQAERFRRGFGIGLPGHQDDLDLLVIFADIAQQVDAGATAQVDVGQHQVVFFRLQKPCGLVEAGSAVHQKILLLEHLLEKVEYRHLVIDD